MPDIRQDPAYAAAFEDAKRGEPLFDTASPAYAAGWRAYWELREAAEAEADFMSDHPDAGGPPYATFDKKRAFDAGNKTVPGRVCARVGEAAFRFAVLA